MFQVSGTDAGKYTCRAENAAGPAESTADIVVRKKHHSPIFLKRLQSQILTFGKKLILEVEIGGLPPPKVTWYFNGEMISENSTRHIKEEGTHFMLHIPKIQVKCKYFSNKIYFLIVSAGRCWRVFSQS